VEPTLQQILDELKRLNDNQEALQRKLEQIEDKLLDTMLEEWVKLQPTGNPITDLLKNAKRKSS
jgi:Flp pilus assembly CpaE family ATPase